MRSLLVYATEWKENVFASNQSVCGDMLMDHSQMDHSQHPGRSKLFGNILRACPKLDFYFARVEIDFYF